MNYYFFKIIANCLLSLCLLGLCGGCLGKSHLEPRRGDFCCLVEDALTGEAIPGVVVTLGNYTLITDNSGVVALDGLAPGDYEIKLTRPRYIDKTYNLHYIGKTAPISISLNSETLTGRILYSSDLTGKREIYILDLGTRAVTRLTENNSSETNPALLGKDRIIFQSDSLTNNTNDYDLFSYDMINHVIEGTIYKSASNDQYPAADQSGKRIVFQSEGMKVFYDDLTDGLGPRLLGPGQRPTINAAGDKIAFVNTKYKEIWVTKIDGTLLGSYAFDGKDIPNASDYKISNPCWSQDGTKIAFEAYLNSDGPRWIYYIDLAVFGAPIVQVTYSYGSGDQQHEHPCWSDKDSLIYFSANIIYSGRRDIYCLRVDEMSLALKENNPWLMVSRGSGSKDYPSWGGL